MDTSGATPSFEGLRVLALESRRATEVAALISTYGGQPLVAPALREVPLESNIEALDFAAALMRGEFDIIIFLTGVGTRALVSIIERAYPREAFIAALARTKIVARGPKPLAALRELQMPIWVAAPEPNTWRELLAAIDAKAEERSLGQIVEEMRLETDVRRGLARAVMASIGPMTSDELRRHGLAADFEPSHPKSGLLVREAAERSEDLLRAKRSHGSDR